MKIHKIHSEYSNDFYATFECEHCGHLTKKEAGYHDTYFHTVVIPGRFCTGCGRNRVGELDPLLAPNSPSV